MTGMSGHSPSATERLLARRARALDLVTAGAPLSDVLEILLGGAREDAAARSADDDARPASERKAVEALTRDVAAAIELRSGGARAPQGDDNRMELVARGADVGIWYCPLPFDKLIWDEHVKHHFHLPPGANVSIDTFYERLHPEDRERTAAAIARSIEERTTYDIDYRTVSPDGAKTKWIRALGRTFYDDAGIPTRFDGVTIDITERKQAEHLVRDSERRYRQLAEERRLTAEALRKHVGTLASLSAINRALVSSTDTDTILQTATDSATQATGAQFGAFFYNVVKESGEQYLLYSLAGAPREAFAKLPMPRNTEVFAPTFTGTAVVRSADITLDPRYGKNAPYRGMPQGHLPVRSYLAVPVKSRTNDVIGGLFFGHSEAGVFDEESERYAIGIAAQAAIALDNARLYADLRRSEERYALAARATNDAIWDWDLAASRVSWNHAVADLFGYVDAVKGTTTREWWLERVHPDDRERVARTLYAVINDPSAPPWADEYRFQCADGSWADVFDRGTVLRDAAGKGIRMVGAMLDATASKHAERERQALLESEQAARAAAEQAGRMRDEFLATLSHELRTPLNAILGWTHLLSKGLDDAARTRHGIEVIERNARVQTQLISDLLDVSRITSGKLRLDVQRVELPIVIDAALEAVRPAADAKGVRVQTVIEPIVEPVHGDPSRLQQIIWNLVSNAVKFTPKGGRVQVVLARVNSHVEIRVSDTGEGIDPKFLPHLFRRFTQADASASREHAGLGLGLALVKQLTELHGGRVSASSGGRGTGATFVVELPLAIIHSRDPETRVHPRTFAHPPIDAPRLDGLHVLVVDDEHDALEMTRHVLEHYGAAVATAPSADAALAALGAQRFDVVLSDIGMPRKDGFQFIAEARRAGHRVPAAALTAFARSEDRTRALMSGYQAHVAKPVEPAELVATIVSLAARGAAAG